MSEQWKPDVLRLSPKAAVQLREYVDDFVEYQHPDIRDDESLAVMGALLELAGHKNPRIRVLELGGDAQGYKAKQWLRILGKETAFSLCQSWHAGDLSEIGDVSIKDGVEGPFDVVVIPKVSIFLRLLLIRTVLGRGHPVANLEYCNSMLP